METLNALAATLTDEAFAYYEVTVGFQVVATFTTKSGAVAFAGTVSPLAGAVHIVRQIGQ
jgi:hypothetical protein